MRRLALRKESMEQTAKNIEVELRALLGSIAVDCRRFAVRFYFKDTFGQKQHEPWIQYGTVTDMSQVHMKTSELAQSLLSFTTDMLSKYVLHRLSTVEEAQRRVMRIREIIRAYGEGSAKLVSLLVVLGDIARIVEPELTFPEKLDMPSATKTGVDLIAEERCKQLEKHSLAHDLKEHREDQLAMAAALCASPSQLYAMETNVGEAETITFFDPWPVKDEGDYDPRPRAANGRLLPNDHLSYEDRVKQLTIAGALLAAEIDRLTHIIDHNKSSKTR